jgi:catechol 2,3-dioxygenase-like lactoylglutathione lyase family enzyme
MQKHLEKSALKPKSESGSAKRVAPSKGASSKTSSAKRAQSFTRGVHHLALCTDDIKKTTEFYTRVLGMPLIHALKVPPGLGTGKGNRGNPPYEEIRHYFFDMGNDSTLAFFEIPHGKEPATNRNAIGSMQHCSFVVTPKRFCEIGQRLKANNIAYIGPIHRCRDLLHRPERNSAEVCVSGRRRGRPARHRMLHADQDRGAARAEDSAGGR